MNEKFFGIIDVSRETANKHNKPLDYNKVPGLVQFFVVCAYYNMIKSN